MVVYVHLSLYVYFWPRVEKIHNKFKLFFTQFLFFNMVSIVSSPLEKTVRRQPKIITTFNQTVFLHLFISFTCLKLMKCWSSIPTWGLSPWWRNTLMRKDELQFECHWGDSQLQPRKYSSKFSLYGYVLSNHWSDIMAQHWVLDLYLL